VGETEGRVTRIRHQRGKSGRKEEGLDEDIKFGEGKISKRERT